MHEVDALEPGTAAHCTRCGSVVARHTLDAVHRTAAFSLAALVLYIPANIFPILHLEVYGAVSENTVWDGVVKFFQDGNYVIALIVLMASVLIPLLKLLGLFMLVGTTVLGFSRGKKLRTWVYKSIEVVGRWAMLDVFVVAIWVAVVKMGQLATVTPGPGLLPFAGVVVFTILASASFDPHLIWNREDFGA